MSTPKTIGTPVSSATRLMPGRALAGHEVEVRCVAADDRAEADHGVELPDSASCLRHERDLERARDPVHRDRVGLDAVLGELVLRAVEQRLGDVVVEPPGDDRETHAGGVELAFVLRVLAHATTTG